MIPYCSTTAGRISRLSGKAKIKIVFKPPHKVGQFMGSVEESLELEVLGIYRIPCSCGGCYTGQMGCTLPSDVRSNGEVYTWGR